MKYSTKLLNFQAYRSAFIIDLHQRITQYLHLLLKSEPESSVDYCKLTSLITKGNTSVHQGDLSGLISVYYSSGIKRTYPLIEAIIKEYLFIKRAYATTDWKSSWMPLVQTYYKRYYLTPDAEITAQSTLSLVKPNRESFTEYATRVTAALRRELNAPLKPAYNPVISPTECFIDLHYVKGDSPYNKKESFFLTEDQVLASHLTPYFVKDRVNAINLDNTLCYNRCYRRENPDKTHLCEFNQLEIHLKSNTLNPAKELKEMFLRAYMILGLDPRYIEFRTTHYPYVSPAYQMYYTKNQFIELGGCGIMLNSVISNPDLYLAGAIGLERCYTLLYGLTTIAQVHPKIYR